MNRKSKAAEFMEQGYSISVVGRNVQVTDSMKDYAMEKIAKIERFSERIIEVHISMDVQKLEHRVDISVKIGNVLIKSRGLTDDMYASIDKAVDRIDAQLRRYKARIQNHHAKPLEVIDMAVNVFRPLTDQELAEVNDDIEEENSHELVRRYTPHPIISQEKVPLKILNEEEAIMKLELSGDTFLIFKNDSDRKIRVIYRRKDGNYGLMYPEV